MVGSEPIAIVGSGCRFPGSANTPSTLWDLLRDPRDLLVPIPEDRFSVKGFYHPNGQHHGHTNVRESYFLAEKGVHRRFDAQFFGISPAEASTMDPQMRLLLEVVYEALENAGQTIKGLQGSDTAVYAGLMTADYEHQIGRDEDSLGTYHVTGVSRALMSNRISYFFDWHGPSMTLDTACSSSLYAVHHAVQQLRSGTSRVALAIGSNLLLDPINYIGESNLQMLSPGGRSRMWDANADGYARGEGVAAVVLKTLRAAEADGDHIECVIRETAVNQDGRTKSITMPSADAQAKLIETCYARAGLDPGLVSDRPQYFEAHGTGTQAGDPVEAEAISRAFFTHPTTNEETHPLYVGSVKTVIGHTEGVAGLAGILKASLALQHSTIPPNLLFNTLNPKIKPFYTNLHIPTSALPWPAHPAKTPRRASVNSFGFGGSNAHAILESYASTPNDGLVPSAEAEEYRNFIFSAASEHSLQNYLASFGQYLRDEGANVNMRNLAFTLEARRTRFPFLATFSASSAHQLATKIQQRLASVKSNTDDQLATRASHRAKEAETRPRTLAIFTGQGAQWARMGHSLISRSLAAQTILAKLEARLAQLPVADRPTWSLSEELQKDSSCSKIGLAALSQPLSTAVQILLIDLLHSIGVELTAVVGHSSGEIAATYAAGLISAEDAICIAYYRGLHADLACGPRGEKGAMMAVSSSADDIQELLEEPEFIGRACIAALNSASSITVSGDRDAIEELAEILDDEQKFNKVLKVEKAYHSHHMKPCSAAYLDSLEQLGIEVSTDHAHVWFSSVYEEDVQHILGSVQAAYWDANLLRPVLFEGAVKRACHASGFIDLVIEIGPHPTLKSPVLNNIQDALGYVPPYTGLLRRDTNDLEALAEGLGRITMHLGQGLVNFEAYEELVYGPAKPHLLRNLPTYSWDHNNEYWHESRYTKAVRERKDPVHELLGHLQPTSTYVDMHWRQILCPKEITWLKGHKLQNQIVFPAAGYVVAALEASMMLLKGAAATYIEVLDVRIGHALTFESEESSVETLFSLTDVNRQEAEVTASFKFSGSGGKARDSLQVLASGNVRICLGDLSLNSLPLRDSRTPNLIKVQKENFYRELEKLDYQYSGAFENLSGLERKLGAATGLISTTKTTLTVHPAVLDGAFQSVLLATSAPGDGRLRGIHVPTSIQLIRFNPALCLSVSSQEGLLVFDACRPGDLTSIGGDVDIFPRNDSHAMVQVEGLVCVPFSSESAASDRVLFTTMKWGPAAPDVRIATSDMPPAQKYRDAAIQLERVACYYLRNLERTIAVDHPSRHEEPYKHLYHYASHVLSTRAETWDFWDVAWVNDTAQDILAICQSYSELVDMRLLHKIGWQLPAIAAGETQAIDVGMQEQLLARYYENALGIESCVTYLSRIIGQIVHKSPRVHCLEIGAGTGGATKSILQQTGFPFLSYTFTDVSSGFFSTARTTFEEHASSMLFKVLDISKEPCAQGFVEHTYDLIVASMVLHATPCLEQTLKNVRRLLKPGGYLVVLEIRDSAPAYVGTIFGAFPGWWLGVNEGRILGPGISLQEWNNLLRKTGFSGCDTASLDADDLVQPSYLFVSQAVDERISFLRSPLSCTPSSFRTYIEVRDLILLGGADARTFNLLDRMIHLLAPHCRMVRMVKTLQDLGALQFSPDTTVLCLLDLDGVNFQHMSEPEWIALRTFLQEAKTILWVTDGRRASNPYANMAVGFARAIAHEVPGQTIQFLDFEEPTMIRPETLTEALLRLNFATLWEQDQAEGSSGYQIEREIVFDERNRAIVPRLLPVQPMNDRYNSSRRQIFGTANLRHHTVELVTCEQKRLLRQRTNLLESSTERLRARVSHSLVSPVRVAGAGYLYLSLGSVPGSKETIVALSTQNASNIVPWSHICPSFPIAPGSEARCLHLIGLHLVAFEVFRGLRKGDYVLVHEPDARLAAILKQEAETRGFVICFTSTLGLDLAYCQNLHPNAAGRTLQNLHLRSVSLFVNLATSSGSMRLSQRMRSGLSSLCRYETLQSIFSTESQSPAISCRCEVHESLKDALCEVARDLANDEHEMQPKSINIARLSEHEGQLDRFSVIDWNPEGRVLAMIQPADAYLVLSGTRTYWLVGLSGSLGLSLCEWMVRHGARHIVISSRAPKVEAAWRDDMAALGAIVKVYPCNVTNRDDMRDLHAMISSTMPQIAGVCQGAMVLKDTQMSDLDFQTLQQVTQPKVEGSMILDSLFPRKTLDFFVLFSSVSSIVGNPGQAPYAAANLFMESLAKQRRRKGLAASIIHIGPVRGVGHMAQEHIESEELTARLSAYEYLSEGDFHQLFAEAVLAGRPDSDVPFEITTGIRPVRSSEKIQPRWASNPMYCHHILRTEAMDAPAPGTAKSKMPIKKQLLVARDLAQVVGLVRTSLLERLGVLLQLDFSTMAQDELDNACLSDFGIDSLMAVETRGWLANNLNVNVPVLKILSGISVGELVMTVVDSLDPGLIPGVHIETAQTAHGDSASGESRSLDSDDDEVTSNSEAPELKPSSTSLRGIETVVLKPDLVRLFELSPAQSMLWVASTLFEDTGSLNFTGCLQISGPLRNGDFREAVRAVGRQHESLRSCFFMSDGRPMQGVMQDSAMVLNEQRIEDAEDVMRIGQEVQAREYDLENGETVRIVLLTQSPTTHFLLFGSNGLVMDGLSTQVLLDDLFKAYNHESDINKPPQFWEHAQKQTRELASGRMEAELVFWKSQFATFPPQLPVLRISSAKSRSSLARYATEKVDWRVSKIVKSQVQTVCRRYHVTPFHFYLACFRALLTLYTDEEDITIGVGDANRAEEESMHTIGVLLNVLPLRFRTYAKSHFQHVLQETRDATYTALENSRLPFQTLLDALDAPRSTTCSPIFQSFIDYRQGQREKQSRGDLSLELISLQAHKTGYDIALDIIDDPEGDCLTMLYVRKDLYSREDAETIIASYQRLVEWYAMQPETKLSQPELYDASGVEAAVRFGLGMSWATQWPETVVHRIEAMTTLYPHRDAVRAYLGQTMTYSELSHLSGSIAASLKAAEIKPGSCIAVLQKPTPQWVASILAVMRVGAIYLPLDPGSPLPRLATILNDCQADLFLFDERTADMVLQLPSLKLPSINVSTVKLTKNLPPIEASAAAAGIVFYTSGSSGTPKGIILKHEGLRNWLEPAQQLYGLGPAEVVLQQSSSSFDMSFTQTFIALCFGGTVCLLASKFRGDASTITDVIAAEGVTLTCATPSEYTSWLQYGNLDVLRSSLWKGAICAGEPVAETLLNQLYDLRKQDLRFFNTYGPTEITLVATGMEIQYQQKRNTLESIPAGHPLPNYSVYVLDECLRLVPPGVQGEIFVGGAGIAFGYLGNDTLTAERFLQNPHAPEEYTANGWTTMHRTGDRGRWRKDGALLIEGRISGDTQVKIHGNRLDLKETEQALLDVANGLLSEAVVSVRSDFLGGPEFLVAHVVRNQASLSTDDSEFSAWLRRLPANLALPRYMRPAAVVQLTQMPMTSSGKLDRRAIGALPLPDILKAEGRASDSVLTSMETALRAIWVDVIGKRVSNLHDITADADFFHVGGTSLLLLSLQAHIRASLAAKPTVLQLLGASTLASMAHLIEDGEARRHDPIDWDEETSLPPAFLHTEPQAQRGWRDDDNIVVLTGATGYLGRAILNALVADKKVTEVHCIGIREVSTRHDMRNMKKVRLYEGDLRHARIGLSEKDAYAIFSRASAIIHNGAQVSHMQLYQSLRSANLQSTKELIALSLPHRIPFHFISTSSVGAYYANGTGESVFPEVSTSAHPPPTDGFGGYPATKWASERFLERTNHEIPGGWPIIIHRLPLISRALDAPELDAVHNVRYYARLMHTIPLAPNFRGWLDEVQLEEVVAEIVSTVRQETHEVVQFRHYPGREKLSLQDLRGWMVPDVEGEVKELPLQEWAHRASDLGMDPTLVTLIGSVAVEREIFMPMLTKGSGLVVDKD